VFAHATPNGAGLVDDIIAAADGINVSPRRSTPGTPIPPSSTFSLLRRDGNVRAAVLAEYDDTYLDPFHGSAWDVGVEAVDPARMAAVAVVLAKTLINVGAGFPAGSPTPPPRRGASTPPRSRRRRASWWHASWTPPSGSTARGPRRCSRRRLERGWINTRAWFRG
jgi:hypothetical protein